MPHDADTAFLSILKQYAISFGTSHTLDHMDPLSNLLASRIDSVCSLICLGTGRREPIDGGKGIERKVFWHLEY
jgi:hypothetical protein